MSIVATPPPRPRNGLRRITRHPRFMEYRRLAALVALVNLGVLAIGIQNGCWLQAGQWHLPAIANMALGNLTLGILMRQQRLVNLLFWLATRIPTSWPLWFRWGAGKVFHFGGIHSGANVAGAAWFVLLMVAIVQNGNSSPLTIASTATLLGLLALMIGTALGPIRARHHDLFERTHRFAGWAALALFWVQTLSFLHDQGQAWASAPPVWALGVISLSILSPWLSLKRVPVKASKPSDHVVVLKFDYGDNAFAGSSNTISLNPLLEWHAFANIPHPEQPGFRLVVSRAGDWTGALIDTPPSHVWVKGITTSGVARIETLFKSVVYVATGSGIGPVLPHLLKGAVPFRLIWATRSPRKTYGDALVDEILAHSTDPLIWDTDRHGKPDLSELALRAVGQSGAEAVICISNQRLTRKVVHDVETAGIPAFGAIWDS